MQRVVISTRPAGAADVAFLVEMLVAAAFWRPNGPTGTVADVLGDPRLARYVTGWPRRGDVGVVAVHGRRSVGAAWLRALPGSEPGYGYVDATVPELAVAVVATWRGRGVGARLLGELMTIADSRGLPGVSLSVERDNPARRLYERAGFRPVREQDGAITMLLPLPRGEP